MRRPFPLTAAFGAALLLSAAAGTGLAQAQGGGPQGITTGTPSGQPKPGGSAGTGTAPPSSASRSGSATGSGANVPPRTSINPVPSGTTAPANRNSTPESRDAARAIRRSGAADRAPLTGGAARRRARRSRRDAAFVLSGILGTSAVRLASRRSPRWSTQARPSRRARCARRILPSACAPPRRAGRPCRSAPPSRPVRLALPGKLLHLVRCSVIQRPSVECSGASSRAFMNCSCSRSSLRTMPENWWPVAQGQCPRIGWGVGQLW